MSRDYRKRRAGGRGRILRFALFAAVIGGLVIAGLNFVVRPIVVNGIVDWAAENPTALQIPFVSDIVRGALWSSISEPIDPADKTPVVIVITPGATPPEIGDQLVQAGVIRDARAFVYEAIQRGVTADFQVGRHVVDKSMTVDQIIGILISPPSPLPYVRVVFREQRRIEQRVATIEYLEAHPADPTAPLLMNPGQFYELAAHPPQELLARYPWLKLPAGASLEGFLFPATYELAPSTTPQQLLQMLLDAFVSHAPPGLLKLPPDEIYAKVKLASLVEMEATLDSERAVIAGVYANRLNPKLWSTGLLNADPTLNYANDSVWLQAHSIETWVDHFFWNQIKTSGVPYSQVEFPGFDAYNTYSHRGLPPTPICSPRAASLVAAMSPDTSEGYLYFVAKGDGSHYFEKTQAEHDRDVQLVNGG